jgi:DNA-binding FadR family transcriptional regulator
MDDHERIVAAILNADGEGARRVMSAHLAFVASAMQSVWEV